MSEQDDFLAGLTGGGRRDTSSFRWGEMLRHQKEMDAILRPIMTPTAAPPGPAGSHSLDQFAAFHGSDPGAHKPGVFDAWDARPRLSFITFIVAVAVSLTLVWPALDATGMLPAPFARVVVLGSVCLFLSAWTKALPFFSAGGILLLVAYHMLPG